MASTPTMKTVARVTRDKLYSIFKNLELIKAFENLQADVSETIPAAIASSSTDADSVLGNLSFSRPIATPSFPDEAQKVHAMRAYLSHYPAALPQFDDDASRILASQIFGG